MPLSLIATIRSKFLLKGLQTPSPQGLIILYLQTLQKKGGQNFLGSYGCQSWNQILLPGLCIPRRRTERSPVAPHMSRGTCIPTWTRRVGYEHFAGCWRHSNMRYRSPGEQCQITSGGPPDQSVNRPHAHPVALQKDCPEAPPHFTT